MARVQVHHLRGPVGEGGVPGELLLHHRHPPRVLGGGEGLGGGRPKVTENKVVRATENVLNLQTGHSHGSVKKKKKKKKSFFSNDVFYS